MSDVEYAAPTWATVRALRQRIDELEAQIAEIREIEGTRADVENLTTLQSAFGLSPLESKMVRLLASRSLTLRSELDGLFNADAESDKGAHVYIHRLRRKGWAITTHWAQGYSLSDADRARVKTVLARSFGRQA